MQMAAVSGSGMLAGFFNDDVPRLSAMCRDGEGRPGGAVWQQLRRLLDARAWGLGQGEVLWPRRQHARPRVILECTDPQGRSHALVISDRAVAKAEGGKATVALRAKSWAAALWLLLENLDRVVADAQSSEAVASTVPALMKKDSDSLSARLEAREHRLGAPVWLAPTKRSPPAAPAKKNHRPRFQPRRTSRGPWHMTSVNHGGWFSYAILDANGCEVASVRDDESSASKADAALIKAAPDLLAACLAFLEGQPEAAEMARAAVEDAAVPTVPRRPRLARLLDELDDRDDLAGLLRLEAWAFAKWRAEGRHKTHAGRPAITSNDTLTDFWEWSFVAIEYRVEAVRHRLTGEHEKAEEAMLDSVKALAWLADVGCRDGDAHVPAPRREVVRGGGLRSWSRAPVGRKRPDAC